MNRTKLNIIKKILGTDKWTLKKDKNKYPDSIFVFDENEEVFMEYDEKNGRLFYHINTIHRKIKSIFGLKYQEIKELMKVLVEEHFEWGVRTTYVRSEISSYNRWRSISNGG